MVKIVIIGAGSGFGSTLSIDILSRPPLENATIGLCDINEERLTAVTRFVKRAVEGHNLPATIVSSTRREELLPGADFVVTSIAVGDGAYWGEPFRSDIEIPRKYGVDQAVADTIGPGGVLRFLRTGPAQLAICRDIERFCPNALLLNYTNPMAMLTWLHSAGSAVRNVGLCHSVQGTAWQLAQRVGVPNDQISYLVAGINHQAWFLKLRHNGRDLYPALREACQDKEKVGRDAVRAEMFRQFGYYVTESSPHNSEYLPYFRKTQEEREAFGLTSRTVPMQPGKTREWMKDSGVSHDGAAAVPPLKRSHEYASAIIEAMTTGQPFAFNGNVMNNGLITNLPQGCCVEVPCLVDREGVHPCHVGALPLACAALNRTNVNVQELAVDAVLRRDREAAFHAVALDPLTAAILPLHRTREMFDEMWEAQKRFLGYFQT